MNDMLLAGDDRAIHGCAGRLNFRTKLVRPGFIRLSGVSSKGFPTGLAAMAEESAVDVLLLPPDLSLRRFRVACFDMDSTLIESECIDEMAAFAGAGERISRITRRAMEGLIPFDESLRQRVAALARSSAEIVTHAVERAVPTPGALDFVDFLTRYGLATYIITGGFEEIATHVARRFGMTGVVCNRLVLEDGRLARGARPSQRRLALRDDRGRRRRKRPADDRRRGLRLRLPRQARRHEGGPEGRSLRRLLGPQALLPRSLGMTPLSSRTEKTERPQKNPPAGAFSQT